MCRSDKLKSSCFGFLSSFLFLSFLLSMESMEPGQLSITLYSVCKIQTENTDFPSVDVGFFLIFF